LFVSNRVAVGFALHMHGARSQPLVHFDGYGKNRALMVSCRPMHREAIKLLPSLQRPYSASYIFRNFFPRIENRLRRHDHKHSRAEYLDAEFPPALTFSLTQTNILSYSALALQMV